MHLCIQIDLYYKLYFFSIISPLKLNLIVVFSRKINLYIEESEFYRTYIFYISSKFDRWDTSISMTTGNKNRRQNCNGNKTGNSNSDKNGKVNKHSNSNKTGTKNGNTNVNKNSNDSGMFRTSPLIAGKFPLRPLSFENILLLCQGWRYL